MFNVYKLDKWSRDLNPDFTQGGCLFGGFKLSKNVGNIKYGPCPYDIGFDACSIFSVSNAELCKTAIISGVDNNSVVHVDNTKKNILILCNIQQMN